MSVPFFAAQSAQRITVMRGEVHVGDDPALIMTTVLGSCVSACLIDAAVQVGGMNHFLLAEPRDSSAGEVDEQYGVYLMELLINEMMHRGAIKSRMRAHLYGGANLHPGMREIGTANAHFARQFLEREGIMLTHADLGGELARRVEFQPARGRARSRFVAPGGVQPETPTVRPVKTGDVELF